MSTDTAVVADAASPETIMQAYRDAYQAANGRTVQIDYFKGWYSIYSKNSGWRYRRRQVEALTSELLNRVALKECPR